MKATAMHILVAAGLLATALAAPRARAAEPSLEYRVKAAFVASMVQFVTWPKGAFAAPDAPLVIGVVAPDPFEGALRELAAGRTVDGHPVQVKRVHAPADLAGCQALFVPHNAGPLGRKLLEAARDKAVLTIGETREFTSAGGVVRFYLDEGKVRFEINLAAARRAGVEVSSKLLKLARVKDD